MFSGVRERVHWQRMSYHYLGPEYISEESLRSNVIRISFAGKVLIVLQIR